MQVYLAGLSSGLGEQRLPPCYPAPVYHQLAAAHTLANIQRSLLEGQAQAREVTKPPPTAPSQFSIDELLKQDDKKSRLEAGDSKASSLDEAGPREAGTEGTVKEEAPSSPPSCLDLALAQGGGQHQPLRITSPR